MSKCRVSKILVLTLLLGSSVVSAKSITKKKPVNRQTGRTFVLLSLLHGTRNQPNGLASDQQSASQQPKPPGSSPHPSNFWVDLLNLNEPSDNTNQADEIITTAPMAVASAPVLPAQPPFYPAFDPVYMLPPPGYAPVLMQPYPASDPNAIVTAEFIKGLVGALQTPNPQNPAVAPITGSDTLPILPVAGTTPTAAVRLRIHNLAEESAANSEVDDVAHKRLKLIVAEDDTGLTKLRQPAFNREQSNTDRSQYYSIYNVNSGDFEGVAQRLPSARNSNGSRDRFEYLVRERPLNQKDAPNLSRTKNGAKKRIFKGI